MNDVLLQVVTRALHLLFELLVPISLDLAVRELLIAFLLAGAVWLAQALRARLRRTTVPFIVSAARGVTARA